jgi:hypothetical protein
MSRSFPMILSVLLAACAAMSADERIGDPRPARDASCEITWVSIDDSPATTRDEIAFVHLAGIGPNALDANARERVRQKACSLGGDAASVVASTSDRAVYLVWLTRPYKPPREVYP